MPIGVETKWIDGKLRLRATVVSARGDQAVDSEDLLEVTTMEEAEAYGVRVAEDLIKRGADKILNAINAAKAAAAEQQQTTS